MILSGQNLDKTWTNWDKMDKFLSSNLGDWLVKKNWTSTIRSFVMNTHICDKIMGIAKITTPIIVNKINYAILF